MKGHQHFHFVGIGGIGMSALARLMVALGYRVSGSDIKAGRLLGELERIGIDVHVGHRAGNIGEADCLVVSSSIKDQNPEILAAQALKVPIIHRGEMLAVLMDAQRGIAISGTHGKSTTTAMLAYILESACWDPTTYVGAIVPKYNSNAKTGFGDWFICEADESDESFLRLNPEIAVVTNIDSDHMDHYVERSRQLVSFRRFLEKLPSKGFGVISADDDGVAELGGVFGKPLVTFGIDNPADCMAENITDGDFASSFDIIWRGKKLGRLTLGAPGQYNVQNALAACAVAFGLGIEFEHIKAGLEEYKGISRRFEVHKNNGFMVVDDYAHHPTEVKATLSAARASTDRRIIAVFQPHRYTRTHFLHEEYGHAFGDVDLVVVTDIYSAGERPIENVSSRLVVESIRRNSNVEVAELGDLDRTIEWLKKEVRPGDVIITLGAGDVTRAAEALASDPNLWPEAQETIFHVQTG